MIFFRHRLFWRYICLQVKDSSWLYQAPPGRVAHTLQEPFKKELDSLQVQQVIVLLGMDETSKLCNRFVLVLKVKNKLRLCLEPARLNKELVRPMQRGQTLNDIPPSQTGMKYVTFINASPGYYNLKLDNKSSYLTAFDINLPGTDI